MIVLGEASVGVGIQFGPLGMMKQEADFDLAFGMPQHIKDTLEALINNPELEKMEALLDTLDAIDILPEFEALEALEDRLAGEIASGALQCDL